MTKENVEISIVGKVKKIEMLGERAMSVWPVDFDPRFVVIVAVEEGSSPFEVGKEANLAIHSIARTFMTDKKDIIGKRYIFTLTGTKEDKLHKFSSVFVSSQT